MHRRLLLAALTLPMLDGCAAPFEALQVAATPPSASAVLQASAEAHGSAALAQVHDINVQYVGRWRGLVGSLQPALVNADFRGSSEERLLSSGLVAQSHTGPGGTKQVLRQTTTGSFGTVQVSYNGTLTQDAEQLDAAALVVDGYSLFLLGPMLLADRWSAQRNLVMDLLPPERIVVAGREVACDVLRGRITPGLGRSPSDDLLVYVGRDDHLMRRVRFTLNGLESTRGAVAEVDTWDHVVCGRIRWPTQFHERLLRPLPLPVHDWRMTGLDLNRGVEAADVLGRVFTGRALAPAAPIARCAA